MDKTALDRLILNFGERDDRFYEHLSHYTGKRQKLLQEEIEQAIRYLQRHPDPAKHYKEISSAQKVLGRYSSIRRTHGF